MKRSPNIIGFIVGTGLSATIIFTSGCSSTTPIGKVGNVEFYKVHSFDFDGPNFTALVTKDENSKVSINYVFGSAGIGNSIIAAGGGVAANATMGMSMPRQGDTINNVNGGATTVNTSANTTANLAANSNSRSGNNNSNTSTSNAANQNSNSSLANNSNANTANNTANNANKNDISNLASNSNNNTANNNKMLIQLITAILTILTTY